jgi:hypothetical protein
MTTETAEQTAIVEAVTLLAEYFQQELTPHELRLYVGGLADMAIEDLQAACRLAIQSRRFFPKVAELRFDADLALERETVQTAADRMLAGVVQEGPYVCPQCANTTWVLVETEENRKAVVQRCACLRTNPSLVRRKRYASPSPESQQS